MKRLAPFVPAAAALCVALLFAGLVPLWQGPDEAAHFAYIQYLAEERTMPVYRLPYELYRTDYSQELAQSRKRMDADAVAFHPDAVQRFLWDGPPPPSGGARHVDTAGYHNNALSYSPL